MNFVILQYVYGVFPKDPEEKLSYAERVKLVCRRSDRRSCIPQRILFMADKKIELSVLSNLNICLGKYK